VLAVVFSFETDPIRHMISEKARLTKTGIDGNLVTPVLKAHGTGITDGQETLVLKFIDQAE
jgi:hypothetical protein